MAEEPYEERNKGERKAAETRDDRFMKTVLLVALAVMLYKGWLLKFAGVLVIIGLIATVHEFGHYLASKVVGVRVDEFSVGLGSYKIIARKVGETEYSLRPIPLGAFVKPAGMDPDEEYDENSPDPGERSFARKGLMGKLAILFGGPVANIILTICLASGIYYVVGERPTTLQVSDLLKGKPAHRAGILPGDIIRAINGREIMDYMEGIQTIGRYPGKEIVLTIDRPDDPNSDAPKFRTITIRVTPEPNSDGQGKIGIVADGYVLDKDYKRLTLFESVEKGVLKTTEYAWMMYGMALNMLKKAFADREMPKQIGGPVKIARHIWNIETLEDFVRMTAVLSLSIGVFNLLPIPALDGGRIFILLLGFLVSLGYLVTGRKIPEGGAISPRVEEFMHILGFLFLILLLLLVTWKDIAEWIHPPTLRERLGMSSEEELVHGSLDGSSATTATATTSSP